MLKDIAYSSGFVSIKLGQLLDQEKLQRMLGANNINEALIVLLECDYDSTILNTRPIDINMLLQREMTNTVQFFEEFCTDQNLILACLKKFDYHNAKVILKAKFSDTLAEDAVYKVGVLGFENIRLAIQSMEYEGLPKQMAEALDYIDSLENVSSRQIDIIMDKAMFEEISQLASRIKSQAIKEYFQYDVDSRNLMIAIRSKKRGFSYEDTVEQFLSGGKIPLGSLMVLFEGTTMDISREFLSSPYLDVVETIVKCVENQKDFDQVENQLTDILFELSQRGIFNIFSNEPLFAWYTQKLLELKTVRLVLVSFKNNIDMEVTKSMLRGVYEQ